MAPFWFGSPGDLGHCGATTLSFLRCWLILAASKDDVEAVSKGLVFGAMFERLKDAAEVVLFEGMIVLGALNVANVAGVALL